MRTKILNNWKSGLTVSLVSIPLSLALAIASGATPTQGIITAIWAGFLGSILGSSNFNIMGPTGALSGLLVSYAIIHGYQTLPIIALLSGFLILISYLLRLDKYIIFIPRSVVHGFTLGVACIIGLGQLDNALGLKNIPKTDNFLINIWISIQHIEETQWLIFSLFLISATFLFIWNTKFPKIPGTIVIAFTSIITMMVLKYLNIHVPILTIGDKYSEINGAIFENIFHNFLWETFLHKEIWLISIATAIIAILETLLSGQIAASMTNTQFNRSKEVFALAIANIGSGLMGGIPATAALARTALNIKSHANHKISGIINAISIGIISIFFLSFFKLLPMVVIASILTIVAIGMIEKKHFIHLIEDEKIAFFLSILVALLVIIEDPIIGILIGTVIALLIFVNKISYGQTEIIIWENGKMTDCILKNEFIEKDKICSDLIIYKISGTLTYINMPAHLETIQKIINNKYVILSLSHAFYADIDGIDYLQEIIETLKQNNKQIFLSGVNKEIQKHIHKKSFYKNKLIEGKIFNKTSEALSSILKNRDDAF